MTVADLSFRVDSSPLVTGVRNLDNMTGAAKRTGSAVDQVGTASERAFGKVERSARTGERLLTVLERIEGELQQVSRAVTPLSAGIDRLDASMARMTRNSATLATGTGRATASVVAHTRALKDAHAATETIGKSSKQVANDIKIMQYQLIDVAQGLATGQSPLMVALQQGGQIAQAGGLAGIMQALRAVPWGRVAAVGAPVAAVGVGAYAYDAVQQQTLDAKRATTGVGIRSGLGTEGIERVARDNWRGNSLSISEARNITEALSVQGVGEAGIVKALGSARNASLSFNLSLEDTTKLLADVAENPLKGYDRITKVTGNADAGTRAFIAALQDQGETTKAFEVAIDSTSGRLLKFGQDAKTSQIIVEGGISILSRAKQGVLDWADSVTNASGRAADAQKTASEKAAAAMKAEQVAVEEKNKAYRERADAASITLGIETQLARLNPLDQQVVQAQRSAGVGPAISEAERRVREAETPGRRSIRENLEADIRRLTVQKDQIEIGKALTEQGRANVITIGAETAAIGRSIEEQARLTFVAQARIAAGQGGKAISEQITAQINKEADAYSRLVDNLQRTRLADQIRFDRTQLGRDSTDAGIASALRPFGGIDDPRNRVAADEMRLSADIAELKSVMSTGVTGFLTAIRQGQKPGEAAANMAGQVVDRAISKVVDQGVSKAVGWGMGQFGLDKALPGLTTTASMSVNAGVVTVSGGVGGILPGGAAPIPGVTSTPLTDIANGGRSVLGSSVPGGTAPASVVATSSDLPSWIGRGTSMFRPANGANNADAYTADGSFSRYSDLHKGMTQQADAMRNAGGEVTQALDSTATGIGSGGSDLVNSLSSIARGIGGGGGGGIGGLLGIGTARAGSGGIQDATGEGWSGGWASGGWTGAGGKYAPAGIVHRNEYVIPSETVSRLGASYFDRYLPGYASGGHVTMPMLAPVKASGGGSGAPIVNHTVNNYGSSQVETRESRGPNGEINMETIIRDIETRQATRMSKGRGDMRQAIRSEAGGGAANRAG